MSSKIYVWDILIRIFHWSLVLAFTIGYVTGDDAGTIHVYAGYVVLGLVVFRILWGFIGPEYARFSNFITSPKQAITYLRGLIVGGAKESVGHNPAGGWMVIVLLASLILTSVTGLKVYGVEGYGPLAQQSQVTGYMANGDSKRDKHEKKAGEEFWEEIHELVSNFTVLLIIIHISGVLLSSRYHKTNLVKAMITGYKQVDQ